MTPWLLLSVLAAALNLFIFIWLRGHWGRIVPLLALASLVGSVAGNAIGERLGIDLLRIGDFRFLPACIVAQLAMLAVVLLTALGPAEREAVDEET